MNLRDGDECGKPCPPENPCDDCAEYWHRMEVEGYWDHNNHRWTEKGWGEKTK
jgi:hypothetical protein